MTNIFLHSFFEWMLLKNRISKIFVSMSNISKQTEIIIQMLPGIRTASCVFYVYFRGISLTLFWKLFSKILPRFQAFDESHFTTSIEFYWLWVFVGHFIKPLQGNIHKISLLTKSTSKMAGDEFQLRTFRIWNFIAHRNNKRLPIASLIA